MGGGNFQSFSSNLVRENNMKKQVQDYKEQKKLEASTRFHSKKHIEAENSQQTRILKTGSYQVNKEYLSSRRLVRLLYKYSYSYV